MKSIIALLAVTFLILTLQPVAMADSYDTGLSYTIGSTNPMDGTVYLGSTITGDISLDQSVANNPGTHLNLTAGGSVGRYLFAQNYSTVTLSGGSVGNALFAQNYSTVIMNDGTVQDLAAFGNSTITMNDGTASYLSAYDNSTVIMSGGTVGSTLSAVNNSTVTMSGGSVGSSLNVMYSGMLYLVGSNFSVTASGVTTALSNGAYLSNYGRLVKFNNADFYTGTIAGSLTDGTLLDSIFFINNKGMFAGTGDIVVIPEPATPPVADADGPYSIYVGDTLTLDASGSTDDDNDIVSYMWDLDDDGTFETDAGAEAILVVDYAYLQSLGLLINYTYTIHLKVTDSEAQSDVADSTLIIVPKPATVVAVDIKPGSCPNPVNVKSSGVLPVAILGTENVNVLDIDPTSIAFSIGDVNVGAIRRSYEDVATPVSDNNDCNCITEGPDGLLDLTLKFKTQRIVEAVGEVNDGDVLELPLTGVLSDETPIEGADCIVIRGKAKSLHGADINKDGVVDMADFAIFAQNWLQSSIVDE